MATTIHVLGGGVRGFGVLARYPEGGPRLVRVRRITAANPREAYRPAALVRVEDPAGNGVVVQDLGEDADGSIALTVPPGPAGTWTMSVLGGRQNDRVTLDLPASPVWGVRGEMALTVGPAVPATAWLWVPPQAAALVVDQIGGVPGVVALHDEAGAELGRSAVHAETGRRLSIRLDPAPRGQVVALDLSRAQGLAVLVDGVPGLLCPSPETARALAGGTVESGGFRCAGPLQGRIRAWMAARVPAELAVPVPVAGHLPADLPQAAAEAQLAPGIAGLPGTLARQITDPASPWCGSDWVPKPGETAPPSWDTGSMRLVSPFLPQGLATLVAARSRLNPVQGSPALARRAALAAFHHLSSLSGERLVREGSLITGANTYPIVHAFFVYGSLAAGYDLVRDHLDPEARALWREGLLALGDKLADFQGYQSNQWTHNLLGHLHTWRATGEVRFRERFERQVRAYIAGAYGRDAKFGQHPAGYYLEEFGCDGNYDNMNLAAVGEMLLEYRGIPGADPALAEALAASAEANLRFKSFFWLTDADGGMASPNAFCSRRPESNLMASNPAGDFLLSRDSAWGAARASLSPMPARGAFPATVFPYYATSDDWGRRLLAETLGQSGGEHPAWQVGGLAGLFHATYQRPLATPAVPPIRAERGTWRLPGLVAWKRAGTYGVVFHDIDGTGRDRRLNHAIMGGGPTALWRAEAGMAVASTSNPRRPVAVTAPDEATASTVFATGPDGTLVWSGSERSTLTWLEPERRFAIDADLRGGGRLRWEYTLGEDGAVDLLVRLDAPAWRDAQVSIPWTDPGRGVAFTAADGVVERRCGGAGLRLEAPGAMLTPALAVAGAVPVRATRIPITSDGAPAAIRISPVP